MKNCFFAAFFLILSFNINASVYSPKLPKEVTLEALKEEAYPEDLNADAVIINEEKKVYYTYNDSFFLVTSIRKVIKIYTAKGLNNAIAEINLNKSSNNNNWETVSKIKGVTYTLGNNKILSEKLKKESIFTEEVSDYRKKIKLSLPNVTKGAIIEYAYTITSPFYLSIPTTYIQSYLPTKKINCQIRIPEYFNFNIQTRGGIIDLKKNKGNGNLTYYYKGSSTGSQSNTLSYTTDIYNYSASNVSAIKKEPFVDNPWNYIPSVQFFLRSIRYPNSLTKNYAYTWENVLIKNTKRFESEISKSDYYKDDLKVLSNNFTSEESKIKLIYEFIKQKIKWDKDYDAIPYNGVKSAYKNGIGTSAQINTVLLSMLRRSGIKARPVFVATSQMRQSVFPNYNAFNHLIVEAITSENKKTYLDATQKKAGANVFASSVIKGKAMVLSDSKKVVTINLRSPKPSNKFTIMNYTFSGNAVKGNLKSRYTNQYAFDYRRNMPRNIDKAVAKISKKYSINNISKYENKDYINLEKPVSESFDFSTKNQITNVEDEYYLHPMLFLRNPNTPYKLDNREFPLHLSYKKSKNYVIDIKLSEGYKILEHPKSISLSMPNKWGKFTYNIVPYNNGLKLVIKEEILKNFYTPEEYKILKEFYSKVVEKENEQIVITKV